MDCWFNFFYLHFRINVRNDVNKFEKNLHQILWLGKYSLNDSFCRCEITQKSKMNSWLYIFDLPSKLRRSSEKLSITPVNHKDTPCFYSIKLLAKIKLITKTNNWTYICVITTTLNGWNHLSGIFHWKCNLFLSPIRLHEEGGSYDQFWLQPPGGDQRSRSVTFLDERDTPGSVHPTPVQMWSCGSQCTYSDIIIILSLQPEMSVSFWVFPAVAAPVQQRSSATMFIFLHEQGTFSERCAKVLSKLFQ